MVEIEKVGVVGCGLMGSGIAEVAAKANFVVVVREVSDVLIEVGRDRIRKSLDRAVEPSDTVACSLRSLGTGLNMTSATI